MDLLFPLSRRNLPEGHPSSAQEIITQIIHSLNANLLYLFPDRVAFAYGTFAGKYCNFSNYHQSHYYQTVLELYITILKQHNLMVLCGASMTALCFVKSK